MHFAADNAMRCCVWCITATAPDCLFQPNQLAVYSAHITWSKYSVEEGLCSNRNMNGKCHRGDDSLQSSRLLQSGQLVSQHSSMMLHALQKYTKDMMCGGIAAGIGWRDIGNLHQAVIPSSDKAMKPNKRVYYM